jgi:hypothetical protein
MPSQWPSRRFEKAARFYRSDFENLLIAIKDESFLRQSLFVEERLADFIGQVIRFYLRIFFVATDREDSVSGGGVAPVFSMALLVVNSYCGFEVISSKEYSAPDIPAKFCQSEASQRVHRPRRNGMTADEEADMATVVSDIHAAQSFLDAFHACQYLSDLMIFPGVREEIVRVGGWEMVERHARMEMVEGHARTVLQRDLPRWCPNDAHLMLLSDAEHFFQRVKSYKTAAEKSVVNCEQSLEVMRKRFGTQYVYTPVLRRRLLGTLIHLFVVSMRRGQSNELQQGDYDRPGGGRIALRVWQSKSEIKLAFVVIARAQQPKKQ